MMISTTVTKKGQVTIPKVVRDSLGIKPHDKVTFYVREKEIVMRTTRGSILDLRGSVTPKEVPEDFDRVRTKVKKNMANISQDIMNHE